LKNPDYSGFKIFILTIADKISPLAFSFLSEKKNHDIKPM
jgi:hypothetical protein